MAGTTSALPPPVGEKLGHGPKSAESDGIRRPQSHGEALKRGETTCGPLPRGNPTGILEQVRCPSPVAALLATVMDLEAVVEVECAAGCGHRLYSDRGPVVCPCHWPAARVAQVARGMKGL